MDIIYIEEAYWIVIVSYGLFNTNHIVCIHGWFLLIYADFVTNLPEI